MPERQPGDTIIFLLMIIDTTIIFILQMAVMY